VCQRLGEGFAMQTLLAVAIEDVVGDGMGDFLVCNSAGFFRIHPMIAHFVAEKTSGFAEGWKNLIRSIVDEIESKSLLRSKRMKYAG
jgi:hypothetical protein